MDVPKSRRTSTCELRLTFLPSMLILHVQRVKRRIPKQNAPPIEITKPHQFNNGNVEIIHSQTTASQPPPKVAVDEVLINGRRYRVPERVIVLDFWSKLGKAISADERCVYCLVLRCTSGTEFATAHPTLCLTCPLP